MRLWPFKKRDGIDLALEQSELLVKNMAAIPDWTALHSKVTRHAQIAALFRRRYGENLLPKQRDYAGAVTAEYIAAFVHEEATNKRLGAVRLRLGPPVEEPRGSRGGQTIMQVHSGKRLRFPLTGTDIDGAPADVSGASATSDDTAQVTAEVVNGDSGTELIVTDVSGGNLGSATITVSVGSASAQEIVEVIAGDAVAINIGAGVEENRPA